MNQVPVHERPHVPAGQVLRHQVEVRPVLHCVLQADQPLRVGGPAEGAALLARLRGVEGVGGVLLGDGLERAEFLVIENGRVSVLRTINSDSD